MQYIYINSLKYVYLNPSGVSVIVEQIHSSVLPNKELTNIATDCLISDYYWEGDLSHLKVYPKGIVLSVRSS